MVSFLLPAGVVLVAMAVMVSGTDTQNPSPSGTFSYKNCGDPDTDVINIHTLEITPDPITFPGSFAVALNATVNQTVNATIKGVLQMFIKQGDSWIKIPCFLGFGSCTYEDVCKLLSGFTCPPPFVAAGVPCKCPFNQGDYNLPKAKFEVDTELFTPGDYQAIANFTMNGSPLACIELHATYN